MLDPHLSPRSCFICSLPTIQLGFEISLVPMKVGKTYKTHFKVKETYTEAISDGLRIAVQPAASAAATFQVAIKSG